MSKLVLVETISTFLNRYVVELNDSDPSEYALDSVVCDDLNDFTQNFLGEQISSHRVISQEEFLRYCDTENGYAKDWDTEAKIRTFVNTIDD